MKKKILITVCAVVGVLLIAFAVMELCGFRLKAENTLTADEKSVVGDAIYEKEWVFFCTPKELVNEESGKTTTVNQFFCAVKRYGPLYRRYKPESLPVYELHDRETGDRFGRVVGFEDVGRHCWFLLLEDGDHPAAVAGAWFEHKTLTANGKLTGLYKGGSFVTPGDTLESFSINGHDMEITTGMIACD